MRRHFGRCLRWLLGLALVAACGTAVGAAAPPIAAPPPFFDRRELPLEYAGPGREAPEPEDVTEVRIGYFGPGDPAHPEGGDLWCAASLAVEQANQQGGYRGRPFRLVARWSDDPWTGGAAHLTRMVYTDRVWAILGGIDSASTHLAEQVTTKARLPLLCAASSDRTANSAIVPWIFSLLPGNQLQAPVLAAELARCLSRKPFVVIAGEDHESRSFMTELNHSLVKHRLAPQFQFVCRPAEADTSDLVRRALQSKPAAVLVVAGARGSARLVRDVRAAGFQGQIFGGPAMGRRHFLEAAGGAAEGAILPLLVEPDEKWQAFEDTYRKRFQRSPDFAAAGTYDAVQLLITAIRKSGLNRARIGDALRAISPWNGVTGPVRWDTLGGNTRAVHLGTVSAGRLVTLSWSYARIFPATRLASKFRNARMGQNPITVWFAFSRRANCLSQARGGGGPMRIIEKILVATDFGSAANEALKTAGWIAGKFAAEVCLLHVMPDDVESSPEERSRVEKKVADLLVSAADCLRAEGAEKAETALRQGTAFEQIDREANQRNVNLILIGAGETTAGGHFYLGTTAGRLRRRAAKPVWIVKPGAAPKVRKVLCPVDFSDASRRALKSAIHLARGLRAELHVLSVIHSLSTYYDESLAAEAVMDPDDLAMKTQQRECKRFLRDLDLHDVTLHQRIRRGKPHREILRVAREIQADLLVMGSVGRTGVARLFVGGVARKVAQQMPCSIITVRSEDPIRLQIEEEIAKVDANVCAAKALESPCERLEQGKELLERGFAEEALAHFEECVEEYDLCPRAWDCLATAHQRMGHRMQAEKCEERSKQLAQVLWGAPIVSDVRENHPLFRSIFGIKEK